MSNITMKIQRIDNSIEMPRYAHEGDAGLDLHAAESVTIRPHERKLVTCGIRIEIPDGYAGLVIPRSGLAIKHGISIVNAPGLIDSGYRGEIKVILVNLDPDTSFEIRHGDRIAQLMLVATPTVKLLEADELASTSRGNNGFGSSGL